MIHKFFDFSRLGGFPFNQQRLEYMQTAFSEVVGAIASFIGNNTIVSGCDINGSSVSDGWVIVGGELLPFKGGANVLQPTFLVRTSKTALTFKDNNSKEVQISKYAEFGIGAGAIQWDSLKRITNQKDEQSKVVASGKFEIDIRSANTPFKVSDSVLNISNLMVNAVICEVHDETDIEFSAKLKPVFYLKTYDNDVTKGTFLDVTYDRNQASNWDNKYYCHYIITQI